MTTAQECLAKAAELQARAEACPTQDMRERFQYLADYWRRLTRDGSGYRRTGALTF